VNFKRWLSGIAVRLANTDSVASVESVLSHDVLASFAPELFEAPTRGKTTVLTLRERSRHVEVGEIQAALAECYGDRDAVCKALGRSVSQRRGGDSMLCEN
jgi:transcriptional regulator, propionate catabolism operon regulatory protein